MSLKLISSSTLPSAGIDVKVSSAWTASAVVSAASSSAAAAEVTALVGPVTLLSALEALVVGGRASAPWSSPSATSWH